MATSGGGSGLLLHQQVAIGVPSPTGRQSHGGGGGGGHHHHGNSNSNGQHGGFYQQLSPLTPSATPSPFGGAAQSPFGGGTGAVPSPFATYAGHDRWSLRDVVSLNCLLRLLALVLSFASALSIAAPQPRRLPGHLATFNFLSFPEFRYCMSAAIVASVYSAVQLFKAICDISFKGTFVTDKTSDYVSFAFDQVMAYVMMSSSSVSICAAGRIPLADTFHVAAIVATIFSFAACAGFIATALLSGYRLCKRIIW